MNIGVKVYQYTGIQRGRIPKSDVCTGYLSIISYKVNKIEDKQKKEVVWNDG